MPKIKPTTKRYFVTGDEAKRRNGFIQRYRALNIRPPIFAAHVIHPATIQPISYHTVNQWLRLKRMTPGLEIQIESAIETLEGQRSHAKIR